MDGSKKARMDGWKDENMGHACACVGAFAKDHEREKIKF